MAERIKSMRALLRSKLEQAGSKRSWEHVTSQIGMFCYMGLSAEQCAQLIGKHHVYLTSNGRISLTGLTTANVDYVANAVLDVTK